MVSDRDTNRDSNEIKVSHSEILRITKEELRNFEGNVKWRNYKKSSTQPKKSLMLDYLGIGYFTNTIATVYIDRQEYRIFFAKPEDTQKNDPDVGSTAFLLRDKGESDLQYKERQRLLKKALKN